MYATTNGNSKNAAAASAPVRPRRTRDPELTLAERALVLETIAFLERKGYSSPQIARILGYTRGTSSTIARLKENGGSMRRFIFNHLVKWRKSQGLPLTASTVSEPVANEDPIALAADPFAWTEKIEEKLIEVIVLIEEAEKTVPRSLFAPYIRLKSDLNNWLVEYGQ